MVEDYLFQHYRKEERQFIETVHEWIQQVDTQYAPISTYFVTPRERLIAEQLVSRQDEIKLACFGGYPNAERVRLCFYPSYYQVETSDFELGIYTMKFPTKFAQLSHGSILGTLLGTGIERNRIGDIITDGNGWQVILDETIGHFVQQQIDKVGKVGVRMEAISVADVYEPLVEWEPKMVVASSLRLDTALSKVYNFSRQRAKEFILAGLVKVNYVEVDRPDYELAIGDYVSLRRYGRFQLEAQEGMTRKDNIRLVMKVLVK